MMFQAAIGVAVAAGFFFWGNGWQAVSALFGLSAALSSALMLGTGVTRASAAALRDPKNSMGILYFGAVKRFVLVLAFFMVGLGLLGLDAPAMCAGFIAAQLGFLFNVRGAAKASV